MDETLNDWSIGTKMADAETMATADNGADFTMAFGMSNCMDMLGPMAANFSLEEFVNISCEDISDPVAYDVLKMPGYKICVIVLYCVVIFLGGVGNTLVVLTVLKTKAMWTPTNIFIANLALADIFVCVLDLPLSAYYQITDDWIFGEALCYVIPMLFAIVVYSSTLTLTMIAIDRYMLILFPLAKRITLSIAMALLVLIMVLSVAVASPIAIYSKYRTWDDARLNIHRTYCIEEWPTTRLRRTYTVSTLILQYFLPLLVIAILYMRIFRRIRRRMAQKQQKNSRRTKTTKMLVAVVTVFAITWTPFHIHSILLEFNSHFVPVRFYKFTDAIFRVIALSSSCINPLLYGWMNDNFRTAFLSLVRRSAATVIHREDDSVGSRKTMVINTGSPVRKLYTKVMGGGKGANNNSRGAVSCCSSATVDSPERLPLQSMVVEKNGQAVVVIKSEQEDIVLEDGPQQQEIPNYHTYNTLL